MSGPRVAVTLFSYTNELLGGGRTPDELLANVIEGMRAAGDAVPLVEIDAAQHFRSFPVLDPAEVAVTAAVVHDRGASVSLLGGGADVSPAPGVRIDDETALGQLEAQLRAAAALGAEGLRIPFAVLPFDLLRRALDRADAGVLLLEEVQGPITPADARLASRLADLERTGEQRVRLLLDTSALMTDLPPSYRAALVAAGVPQATVAAIGTAFAERRVPPVVGPLLGDPGLAPEAASMLITAMTRFGHGRAADWLPVLPYVGGLHLKYWDLELAAADIDGPVGDVLDAVAGTSMTVCSEWGGHEWFGLATDGFGPGTVRVDGFGLGTFRADGFGPGTFRADATVQTRGHVRLIEARLARTR